jgi:hypothetical protein
VHVDMPERSAMSDSWHIERDYLNLILMAKFELRFVSVYE